MYFSDVWIAPQRDWAILVCVNQGTHDTAAEAVDKAGKELRCLLPAAGLAPS
jgi:hypothetical protein